MAAEDCRLSELSRLSVRAVRPADLAKKPGQPPLRSGWEPSTLCILRWGVSEKIGAPIELPRRVRLD